MFYIFPYNIPIVTKTAFCITFSQLPNLTEERGKVGVEGA